MEQEVAEEFVQRSIQGLPRRDRQVDALLDCCANEIYIRYG